MAARREIERRFLVRARAWDAAAPEAQRERLGQAYLCAEPERPVRIRIIGERAVLTVKSMAGRDGRTEIECDIASAAARAILDAGLHAGSPVTKTRSTLYDGDVRWEVDQFEGANAGLLIAEAEYEEGSRSVEEWSGVVDVRRPAWTAREITGDPRFSNSQLAL